jgi:hypothetical protein
MEGQTTVGAGAPPRPAKVGAFGMFERSLQNEDGERQSIRSSCMHE